MKGRNGTTSFLPLKGQGGFQRNISNQCLTRKQANQLYDKIEIGEVINIRRLNRHNNSIPQRQATFINDVKQYEKALLSGRIVKKGSNSQMKQWSILSDNIVYIRSEDRDIMNGIDIKPIDDTDTKEYIERWVKKEEKG